MHSKYMLVIPLLFLPVAANGAETATDFCKSIRKLPLANLEMTSSVVHKTETLRSSTESASNGRSIDDIERLTRPYVLSPKLKKTFQEGADGLDGDYSVYKNSDASLFDFMSVEGSQKCPADIWVKRSGNQLEEIKDGPDLGDGCDVVRLYGTFHNAPILIQYAYGSSDEDGPQQQDPGSVQEVRVVKMDAKELEKVCVIRPGKPQK